MAGMAAIPVNMMGMAVDEWKFKDALQALNPEINFDWGARLNIWHPYQDGKQGVFYRARHICSMDRGSIPQAPIWSTKTGGMRVHRSDLTYSELTCDRTMKEVEYLTDGTERESGYFFVQREQKDRLLFIGWQAVARKLINCNVPGVTAEALGLKLGITIDTRRKVAELEVAENRTKLYDASGRTIEAA